MLSINDLKLGRVISINDEPYQVVWNQHIKVARGGAVMKTKLKNLISGNTLEKTFSGSDNIEEAVGEIGEGGYAQDPRLGSATGIPGDEHRSDRSPVLQCPAEQFRLIAPLPIGFCIHPSGYYDGNILVRCRNIEENAGYHCGCDQ